MKNVPISHVRAMLAAPPDTPIRLYSYQGQEAWDRATELGYWSGDADHIKGRGPTENVEDFLRPYRWMRDRMAERIPNFSGDYPMWAWTKRPSTKPKPRPYMGTKESIRLTVVVPRSRILMSDYDDWHSVLNHNLNAKTEAEWDAHCAEFGPHWSLGDADYQERYFEAIEPSWHDILKFEANTDPLVQYWRGSPKYYRVQVCVDRFQWDEVVGVRRFEERK